MTQIHWSKANRSMHYGHRGYDMLSYKPNLDATEFIKGMSFDDESRKSCASNFAEDLPRVIKDSHSGGVSVKDFLDRITNKVIATAPMIHRRDRSTRTNKGIRNSILSLEYVANLHRVRRRSNHSSSAVLPPRRRYSCACEETEASERHEKVTVS